MRRPGGRSQYPWQRRGSGAVNRFLGGLYTVLPFINAY